MWGQQRPFRPASDLQAIDLLARYAHRVAKRAILRPTSRSTSSPIRDLRGVLAPSFCCRLRIIPFDQTSEVQEFEGVDSEGRRVTGSVGAALLRLEFYPVRVLVLDLVAGDLTAAPAQGQGLSGGSTSLSGRQAAAAAEAFTTGENTEPHLTIHLRNRCATEPLSAKRQKRERRVLNLIELKTTGPAFLGVRSIYVGDQSSNDDLKAQIVIALLQARVAGDDSAAAQWFCGAYLPKFLSPRAKRADRAARTEACATAFTGLWRNAGNAELAQAWRPYVKKWVHGSECQVMSRASPGGEDEGEAAEDDERDERKHDRREAQGALSPSRRHRRNVRYAMPVKGDTSSERLSVKELADRLVLSMRQVFRLVDNGAFQPVQRNPVLFDAADARAWSMRWEEKRASRSMHKGAIQHFIKLCPTLTSAGVRKAEYRSRTRKEGRSSTIEPASASADQVQSRAAVSAIVPAPPCDGKDEGAD